MGALERKDSGFPEETVRLNKFLSQAGAASRRHADELILAGSVKVNGRVVTELGVRINPERDRISIDGKHIVVSRKRLYVILNKPKDCITTLSDEKGRTTVAEYVKTHDRVYPVGRLDRNTTGVLFLTNDGELANALMHPKHAVERVYVATLDRPFDDASASRLRKGIELEDGRAKPKEVIIIEGSKRKKVALVLAEGRNREVKRIFEALHYDVKYLDRVAYAGLSAHGLRRGEWRFLLKQEIDYLYKATGLKK